MRAIQVRQPGGLDKLEVVSLQEPSTPGKGDILVRFHASSLNYHDYLIVSGTVPTEDKRIPLSDGAGEVLAVGEGVDEFQVGDKVISLFFPNWIAGDPPNVSLPRTFAHVPGDGTDGCAREMMIAPAGCFTRAPRGFSYAESATLVCAGLTAWRALVVEGGLKAGDVVLVQGTGGVSLFALQFAKAMGAMVIATSSSDEKLERLEALGADHVINYLSEPQWGAAAHATTDARGVDHVIDIGGIETLPQSFAASRVAGHVAMIGMLTGHEGPLPALLMMTKQLRVRCMMVGSRDMQLDMIRAVEATDIHPVIDRTFPLEQLSDAFRYQESGAHFGKIVIGI